MTLSNGKVKPSSQAKDIALIDHAHEDIIRVLEITEETKRQIALKPLEEAIRDAATMAALRDCLRRAGHGLPLVNKAAEHYIRNRRQAGRILGEMDRQQQGRPKKGDTESPLSEIVHLPTYADLGVEKKPAQRMRDMARVPDDRLEEIITKVNESGDRELTAKEIERIGRHIRIEMENAEWQADSELAGSVELVHQGALDFLPTIEPGSVDLILTDPPYSTDVANIEEFARDWLGLALSRVKPTGRAYVFIGSYPMEIHAYLDAFYNPFACSPPHQMRLDMILPWVYRNTLGPSTKDSYKLNWQACLYFIGPDAGPLDCDVLTEKFSVQDINAPDGRHGLRLHPWQKPDEIAERFIRHATSPGQTVLDPFAGTGTFLAAAARLGRNGIGCEIDEEMLSFCKQRGLLV
jgi:hypothetical protein